MNEAAFWARVVKPALHAPEAGRTAWKVPAEIRAGLPDVWWCTRVDSHRLGGWLELKYIPAWPTRPGTPVTIEVTPVQLAHLREAHQGGAICYVLVGVADEWFLFIPEALPAGVRLTRAEFQACAVARGSRNDPEGLRRAVYGAG